MGVYTRSGRVDHIADGATGVWTHSRGVCRLSTSSLDLCVLYLDGYGHGAIRVPIYTDVGSVYERSRFIGWTMRWTGGRLIVVGYTGAVCV